MAGNAKIIAVALSGLSILGISAVSTVQNDKEPVTGSGYSTYGKWSKTTNSNKAVVEVKTETKEVLIPYSTTTTQDNSRAKGTSYVKTDGRNGKKLEVYKVTYSNGKETKRELVSSKTIEEPVTRVVAEGTYVKPILNCQNGSYVNSAGNEVCRPSQSNTGGATARCRDGSYSYSRSRRGTCSHHGGVAQWL